ncbi:LamG-like jellyroll fold domain-containing protein [Puniceicoccus vermicola]|uniref:PEP-CTERM sorting domain-containing protein n=2 Tax=Puniceicoccus vermicola TaxID=388746 RepID=A0A7X1E619_9BACT|nr:PEP-CTERM sorting domain-containing protein [Puniceicoccus vermicola]
MRSTLFSAIDFKSSLLAIGTLSTFMVGSVEAVDIGYWTFEEGLAGTDIVTAVSSANSPTMDATQHSGNEIPAAYSSNVGGAYVYDPVSGSYRSNNLSMYGAAGAASDDTQLVITGGSSQLTNSYTVEMFILVTDPNNGDGPANLSGTDRIVNIDGNTRYNVNVGSNNLQFRVDTPTDSSGTSVYEYGAPLEDGQWHHLGFTLDYDSLVEQTTISLYVDYANAGSVVIDGQFDPFNDIRFGHDGSNDGIYDWWFDEVRISDSALTSDQFLRYSAVPEPSTLALISGVIALGIVVTRRRRS